jgi:hypothetical protein
MGAALLLECHWLQRISGIRCLPLCKLLITSHLQLMEACLAGSVRSPQDPGQFGTQNLIIASSTDNATHSLNIKHALISNSSLVRL